MIEKLQTSGSIPALAMCRRVLRTEILRLIPSGPSSLPGVVTKRDKRFPKTTQKVNLLWCGYRDSECLAVA